MANATATFTLNAFPHGRDLHQNHLALVGTIAISASGDYPTNGIPISFVGPEVYTGIAPFWGNMYTVSSGLDYRFDPVHQTVRIYDAGTEHTASPISPADTDVIYAYMLTDYS